MCVGVGLRSLHRSAAQRHHRTAASSTSVANPRAHTRHASHCHAISFFRVDINSMHVSRPAFSPHKGSTQGIQFVWVGVTLSQCSAMLASHSLSRNPQCTCVHGHHLARRYSSHHSVLPPGSSRPRQPRSCQGTDLTRPRDVRTRVCACVGTLLRDVHPLHCAYERAHPQVSSYGGVWWTVVGGGWWWTVPFIAPMNVLTRR